MEPTTTEQTPTTDLLILGGGIVGAGIARDAALRGLCVTLIERWNIGWGTSSRTSRLIHGGIRYLEQGDIALVRESLRERATLLRIAPDLVHATPFLFVIDRGAWWQWFRIGVGVMLYRLLAGRDRLGPHHPLLRGGVVAREPLLANAPLLGGALYQDARGDDRGLVRANAAAAREAGATILEETHASVQVLPGDAGVVATLPDGRVVAARTMVIAAGPWTDEVRADAGLPSKRLIGGTKGIHIAFDMATVPLHHAIAMRHPDDSRVMFCVPEPERGRVYVGTTDTDTDEPPEALTVSEEDVTYLLRAAQHLFPALALTRSSVTETWVGVRPLLRQDGSESARSREHLMLREGAVLTVAGGKFTTYRAMAEEAVDTVGAMLGRKLPPCRTAEGVLSR
jgi:glycerol-3-phosphate dehydrogenase